MFTVEFDWSQWEQAARSLGASIDQIPFAMSVALNKATDETRTYLIKTTWPSHIKQRNSSFIAASLTTKGARATKYDIQSEIYDKLDRGNLLLHATGGTRRPKGGGTMAVPVSDVPRTSHGVPQR